MKSQKLKKLKNNAKNYNMYRMESEEIDYPEEDLFGSDSDEDTNQTYDDYVLDLQESAARQLGQRELDIDKRTDLSKFEKILLKLDAAHDIYKDDTKFEYIQDIPIPKEIQNYLNLLNQERIIHMFGNKVNFLILLEKE